MLFSSSYYLTEGSECIICMEHSSHTQLIRESSEDIPSWVNFQDFRPEQPKYTVTFNGQSYNGLEVEQILDGIKSTISANPRIDMTIVLEGNEGNQPQAQLPA